MKAHILNVKKPAMKATGIFCFTIALAPAMLLAQQPDLGTEQQRASGKAIYDKKCAQCHGEAGDGQGVAAEFFKPLPRDFTSGQFKIRSTATGELPTHEDLKKIIKDGMPYTGMPPWPDLSNRELSDLAYYIKTFSSFFADPDYQPEPLEFPSPPAYSEESAQKGRAVFEANECIACHGNEGRGDGPSAPNIVDNWNNHIRPADMTKRWTYRGGSSREDIYRTFTTGVNGTPMPSYQGLISPEDQWHLVDYVYSLSRENPKYSTLLISTPNLAGELDIAQGEALFAEADSAYFPIVGQVIEPGREYYPGVNGIYVKAVHNETEIAFMLKWSDIRADLAGSNAPDMEVEEEEEQEEVEEDPFADFDQPVPFDDPFAEFEPEESYADAVALQFPREEEATGVVKPYLMFGDRQNPVDLWFTELAAEKADVYIGKGSDNLTIDTTQTLEMTANFSEGEWTVIYKRSRQAVTDDGMAFSEGTFIPIAFTVWDGFNKERGNKRGLSSWYHLYIEPLQQPSAVLPMLKWGFVAVLFELVIIGWVRIKNRKTQAATA